MKNIFLAAIGLLLSVNISVAQKQGHITMEITAAKSSDEQTNMMIQTMIGSTTEIYFSEKKNLSVMNLMGGMVTMTNLVDSGTGKTDMLFDMMGQKMHIETSQKEIETNTAVQKSEMEKYKVEYKNDDVKEIIGHKCIKAIIMDPKTNAPAVEMYIAKDMKADAKLLQGMQYFNVDGFPLEINIIQPEMSLTMTAQEFEETVSEDVFNINTTGYKKMSHQDFLKQMGGLVGGLGF